MEPDRLLLSYSLMELGEAVRRSSSEGLRRLSIAMLRDLELSGRWFCGSPFSCRRDAILLVLEDTISSSIFEVSWLKSRAFDMEVGKSDGH